MTIATTDAQPAASSPAPEPVAAPSIASLTQEERAHWRLTGEKPSSSVPAQDGSAESSPAPAGDQPASTDALPLQAASEPAKGKGVKARSAELDAEIAEMRDKLKLRAALREELHRPTTPVPDASPAASSPAPAVSELLRNPDVGRPMLTEQEFFATYPEAAYGQYSVYTAKYVLAEDRQQTQIQHAQQQQYQGWAANAESVRSEHPDFDVQLEAFRQRPFPNTPANQAIGTVLMEQGNARVAYHLATHPEIADRLVRLTPAAALVELGKLDASLGSPHQASTPSLKTITTAPSPPPSITQRATVPASDIDAALASGDFTRYKQLANARDIAAARGTR